MPLNAWLALAFSLPSIASYVSWCVGRLPRARVWLAVASAIVFVIAIGVHGMLLSAPQ